MKESEELKNVCGGEKMNVNKYLESDYVTVQMVKESQRKKACILSAGAEDRYMEKVTLKFQVELDGRIKMLRMNRKTMKNCTQAWGEDTDRWISQWLELAIEMSQNKMEMVIGYPLMTKLSPPISSSDKPAGD